MCEVYYLEERLGMYTCSTCTCYSKKNHVSCRISPVVCNDSCQLVQVIQINYSPDSLTGGISLSISLSVCDRDQPVTRSPIDLNSVAV